MKVKSPRMSTRTRGLIFRSMGTGNDKNFVYPPLRVIQKPKKKSHSVTRKNDSILPLLDNIVIIRNLYDFIILPGFEMSIEDYIRKLRAEEKNDQTILRLVNDIYSLSSQKSLKNNNKTENLYSTLKALVLNKYNVKNLRELDQKITTQGVLRNKSYDDPIFKAVSLIQSQNIKRDKKLVKDLTL